MKALLVAVATMALVQQQQCDIGTLVGGKAAEKFREYFPEAEVVNVIPCVLSVETHVDNVSRKLIVELAQKVFAMPEMRQLVIGMEISGYNYFLLGFTYHTIVFDRHRGVYYVFDAEETGRFFQRAPNVCIR